MVNARVAWVTKYDLSFKKRKRKIHFRSSGFSSQDFYTATVLHLILSASFNYENESSFINSSSLKLPTAGQVTQCSGNKRPLARCIWDCRGGAGFSAVLGASLLNRPRVLPYLKCTVCASSHLMLWRLCVTLLLEHPVPVMVGVCGCKTEGHDFWRTFLLNWSPFSNSKYGEREKNL